MTTITDIIKPIQLLAGSHSDTAETGSGCFMNVIAYLNGEPQITDRSPCVCITVRRIAIWFNDFLGDDERPEMIPFIERAMGSATSDLDEMKRRLKHLAVFSAKQRGIKNAADAAYAAHAVVIDAAYTAYVDITCAAAHADAAAYAVYNNVTTNNAIKSVTCATIAASTTIPFRDQIKTATFEFLDAVLPPATPPKCEVLKRAITLVSLI